MFSIYLSITLRKKLITTPSFGLIIGLTLPGLNNNFFTYIYNFLIICLKEYMNPMN